jgi:purine-binding chemotaxis protein CheW
MERQLIVLNLAEEHYGVDIGAVESIVELPPITAAPHAPGFIEGVANLRGALLPVVDLRKRFGLPVKETSGETRVVVVEMDGVQVGMVVDAVMEVLRAPEEAIEPPPAIVLTVDGDWGSGNAFITGIAKVGERLIILLDLNQVLSPEEQASLQTLAQDLAEDDTTLARRR